MQKEETEKKEKPKRLDLDNILESIKTNLRPKLNLSEEDIARIEKIEKTSHVLNNDVDNLEYTIKGILDKQYNEYIKTFENFMDTVRKELRQKIEQMEIEEKRRAKENDIRIIKCEREFFKSEAVRLNGLCKDMSAKIEEMAFQMKLLSNELNTMTSKWKESENVNKQLLVELESNIQSMKDLEKENGQIKEKFQRFSLDNNQQIQNNIISNYNEENDNNIMQEEVQKDKLMYIIEKLKCDLRKERMRNHKTLGEFNKMILEKNKLENIFNDCVEEVRKEIFNRKLKETIGESYGKRQKNEDEMKIPYVSEIKFDKFLPSDKRKILELFILKDDVAGIVKDLVFNKPKSEIEQMVNMQGINILNENRIQPPAIKGPGMTMTKSNFDIFSNSKSSFMKSKFNLSNSFGKKTHLNFGLGGKIKNIKPSNNIL